jgi:alpha 1,2-mannosyltransferase
VKVAFSLFFSLPDSNFWSYKIRMAIGHARRLKAILLASGAVFIISLMHLYGRPKIQSILRAKNDVNMPLAERQVIFWQNFLPLLEKHAPDCPPTERDGISGAIGFDAVNAIERPDLIIRPETHQQPI